jgi:hypothetical protein
LLWHPIVHPKVPRMHERPLFPLFLSLSSTLS